MDDSGPGVKPELRQAIFERFRQGDGGISRNAAGTGLGLAIAKEFVEMHKGRIDVLDSEPRRRAIRGDGCRWAASAPTPPVTDRPGSIARILDGVARGAALRRRQPKAGRTGTRASPPPAGRACSSSRTTPT